jgi:hypothetical protein
MVDASGVGRAAAVTLVAVSQLETQAAKRSLTTPVEPVWRESKRQIPMPSP